MNKLSVWKRKVAKEIRKQQHRQRGINELTRALNEKAKDYLKHMANAR